jgi:hypothetical protein
VVEHTAGKYDDQYAVHLMYDALAEDGHLILTVPVDRQFWEEYRDREYYGTSKEQSGNESYFFQRYYDKAAIWERLVNAIGVQPSSVRWFGEKHAGHFAEYEKRWQNEGINLTFNDPLEIAENYQEFPSWETMPGIGVCGMLFKKSRLR